MTEGIPMRIAHAAVSAVLIAATATAQLPETVPPGFQSVEALNRTLEFGVYASYRAQIALSFFKGKTTVVSALQLRQENRFAFGWSGARRFSNVTLMAAHTDYARLSTKFAQNLTTATVVFSSAVSWPSLDHRSTASPAPWGGPGGSLVFPFNAKWKHGGADDMLFDFRFQGGQLANRRLWTT